MPEASGRFVLDPGIAAAGPVCGAPGVLLGRGSVLAPATAFGIGGFPVGGRVAHPNTFVIGAHKAGSTRFCGLLAQHPAAFVSSPKEPGYFARSDPSPESRARYSRLFDGAGDATVLVDGSTIYSQVGTYPGTAGRIAATTPGASIIYLVRRPTDRARSAWMQYRSEGRLDIRPDFNASIRSSSQLLDASLYWRQLSEYRSRFDRVLVLFFEDFVADEEGQMRVAFGFLGLDPTFVPDTALAHRNASEGKRAPSVITQRWMARLGWSDLRPVKRLARRSRVLGRAVRSVRTLLTADIDPPTWDPATRAWFEDQVREDAAMLLESSGRSADFWSGSPVLSDLRRDPGAPR